MTQRSFTLLTIATKIFYLGLTDIFDLLFLVFFCSLIYHPTIILDHDRLSHLTHFNCLLYQLPSIFSQTSVTMIKWDLDKKLKLLLTVIEQLNPTSLNWSKLATAMGPEYSVQAIR